MKTKQNQTILNLTKTKQNFQIVLQILRSQTTMTLARSLYNRRMREP